ncbi:hypothetical protein [Yoonia sp. 208BN28-4]|uniref:hypothetical protein n=1 Tax=Yoonia sp. 208BN28-4 TaxID=3126505 RepID=UPI00309BC655
MPQYILTYHGGTRPASDDEVQVQRDRFQAWLGTVDAVMPQQPLTQTLTFGDFELTPMVGYSIVTASDIDAARAMAETCPFLEMENTAMQVSQLMGTA